MNEIITPYKNDKPEKRNQVAKMFNNIAPKYDFLNHFLSMGIDILWRKKAIKLLKEQQPESILDIATGTGDFALAALKLNPLSITGVDISEGMLEVGKKKIKEKGLENIISLELGDSENLRFEDETFDAITVGFGVRNFQNLEKGLSEMLRVLTKDGTIVILEFSKPKAIPINHLYDVYFTHILPAVGKYLSKDNVAYEYLPNSVKAFPDGKDFLAILNKLGYTNTKAISLSFGIATIYIGKKQ